MLKLNQLESSYSFIRNRLCNSHHKRAVYIYTSSHEYTVVSYYQRAVIELKVFPVIVANRY